MKINKVLIGLMAVVPFTITSCNNAMSYAATRKWVATHYTLPSTEENKKDIIVTIDWDYHATTGTKGKALIKNIFDDLAVVVERELGITGVIDYEQCKNSIGEHKDVGVKNVLVPFNDAAFENLNGTGHFGKEDPDNPGQYLETFKVYDNALNVTSKVDFTLSQPEGGPTIKNIALVYTYDTKGYLTGYGFKIGRYFIESGNIVKIKVNLMFEYSH